MRGQILAYVADSQMGLVVSPDGQRLSFREIDWQEPIPPARGMTVEFTAIEMRAWSGATPFSASWKTARKPTPAVCRLAITVSLKSAGLRSADADRHPDAGAFHIDHLAGDRTGLQQGVCRVLIERASVFDYRDSSTVGGDGGFVKLIKGVANAFNRNKTRSARADDGYAVGVNAALYKTVLVLKIRRGKQSREKIFSAPVLAQNHHSVRNRVRLKLFCDSFFQPVISDKGGKAVIFFQSVQCWLQTA